MLGASFFSHSIIWLAAIAALRHPDEAEKALQAEKDTLAQAAVAGDGVAVDDAQDASPGSEGGTKPSAENEKVQDSEKEKDSDAGASGDWWDNALLPTWVCEKWSQENFQCFKEKLSSTEVKDPVEMLKSCEPLDATSKGCLEIGSSEPEDLKNIARGILSGFIDNVNMGGEDAAMKMEMANMFAKSAIMEGNMGDIAEFGDSKTLKKPEKAILERYGVTDDMYDAAADFVKLVTRAAMCDVVKEKQEKAFDAAMKKKCDDIHNDLKRLHRSSAAKRPSDSTKEEKMSETASEGGKEDSIDSSPEEEINQQSDDESADFGDENDKEEDEEENEERTDDQSADFGGGDNGEEEENKDELSADFGDDDKENENTDASGEVDDSQNKDAAAAKEASTEEDDGAEEEAPESFKAGEEASPEEDNKKGTSAEGQAATEARTDATTSESETGDAKEAENAEKNVGGAVEPTAEDKAAAETGNDATTAEGKTEKTEESGKDVESVEAAAAPTEESSVAPESGNGTPPAENEKTGSSAATSCGFNVAFMPAFIMLLAQRM
eukprot:TRINITY_DN18878_c0_g1_i1.p1 TRINITY_DN18878_c0_g1~~TRINITY_DN18878_c0_g1_i1.p1  ORF type:complete len:570 (+),score=171.92 TRINITY_DN18878_c0_g1_i1:56-1711(+)